MFFNRRGQRLRIFHSLVIGLSFVGISAMGAYQQVAEKKLFNGDTLKEFKFDNGLKLLFIPRTRAEVLTYQVWFDVGSVDEKLDPKLKKTGLAHLFEHMMFRGSEKYPDGKFEELTARMGADQQNASTYFYRTNYYQNVPSSKLETIMELEADRMRYLKLTSDLLEKEKGAVVGEYRRHRDTPTSMAFDELLALAYEVSPFRYTILGTEEEIKGFTLEEAQYFYKTFYAPNNATIIVAGNADEKTLLNLVEKYYGTMPSQKVPKAALPEEPVQKKERIVSTEHAQATSEVLVVAYKVPPVEHADNIPLNLLGAHLSSGMEARLRKLLVDKGIAVRASASVMNRPDLFEFFVLLTEKQNAEKALKIIDQEVGALQKKAISKDSFERAKNQELLSLYNSVTDNTSLANMLGEYLMLSGDYMKWNDIVEGYKKLSPTDLQRVAKKYLVKSQRSVVIMRPAAKGKS
jgi:zinc protease